MTAETAFAALTTFDPELARSLADARRPDAPSLPEPVLAEMADTIFLAFEKAFHLGTVVAGGYRKLLEDGTAQAVATYSREIRQACGRSAALGEHLAAVLPALLRTGDDRLLDAFRQTLAILLAKGEYLVKAPLEPLPALAAADTADARAYLAFLHTVFDRPLSYNRCQYLGNLLPRAVGGFPPLRRRAWIVQLTRLAAGHLDLIEPCLEGLSQGLERLTAEALHRFVDRLLAEAVRDADAARRFAALRSGQGREACRALQTAATLEEEMARLNRYLAARTGRAGRIAPLSSLRPVLGDADGGALRAVSDGVRLYLPDTADRFKARSANAHLLRTMAKFEAGLIEFGTFTFDLERARDLGCLEGTEPAGPPAQNAAPDVFTAFSRLFDNPGLALDLLTIYEHARIRVRLTQAYPGLVRSGLPVYQAALKERIAQAPPLGLLDACYGVLALAMPSRQLTVHHPARQRLVQAAGAAFAACDPATMRVEHCAGLVVQTHRRFQKAFRRESAAAAPLDPPLRMALRPDLVAAAGRDVRPQLDRLTAALERCGISPYRGDLRQLLQHTEGRPGVEAILRLPGRRQPAGTETTGETAPPPLLPASLLVQEGLVQEIEDPGDVDRITWFKEWNAAIGDYLHDHVRVRDRRLKGGDEAFYQEVLGRCEGLVRRIRRSFELLRPEGLALLRQWVEGDDFDYRALLDFALDRKAGRLPSDRLYIKRVKQRRDVAVMLLVDLSRSTSNIVKGSTRSVLDVAKEAVVLFTQALEVVGDSYAVAGFSGTGRLGVDFFRIKDFDEPLGAAVKATLSALSPQRSTRMGAAVRRAARELAARDNRVRLLLMIGDGFPNDTAYKGDYAVQDTRQAIAEARSSGIVTQAITVNLPASPRLDTLYGPVRHTVITRVDELPDKLLRLYGALTRP